MPYFEGMSAIMFQLYGSGLLISPRRQENSRFNFQLSTTLDEPKSLKVGYWRTILGFRIGFRCALHLLQGLRLRGLDQGLL